MINLPGQNPDVVISFNPSKTTTPDEPEQPEDDENNMNYEELKFYVYNVSDLANGEYVYSSGEGGIFIYSNSNYSIHLNTSNNSLAMFNSDSDVIIEGTYDSTNSTVSITSNTTGAVNPIISLTPIDEPEPEPEPPTPDQPEATTPVRYMMAFRF